MRTIGNILFIGMLVMNYVGQLPAEEKSPAILLQEALYQEETAGNLDKAMELYGQVLQQAADVERLAARAAYQLGLCHLKKENPTEAAVWFRKVVNNYPKQASMVKKAQAELQKIAPNNAGGGLYDQATEAIWSILGSMYGQTCAKAGIQNLYANSNIHFVNTDFIHWNGGYGYYMNTGTEPVSGRVRLSGTTNPNQQHFDIMGNPLKTEIVPDKTPGRERYYNIFLNLPQQVSSMSFFPYAWAMEGSSELPLGVNRNHQLVMQNYLGNHAFEVFYLVIPNELTITESTEPHTDKQTVGDFTIYAWEKEVQPDENHLVMVSLTRDGDSDLSTQKLEQPINVNFSTSPDGDKLTVQCAAMEIAKAAEIPYQWQKSQDMAGSKARRYIDPFTAENKTAAEALTELLAPVGLTYRIDDNGLFLSTPENLRAASKSDKLKAEDLTAEGWRLWQQRKLAEAEAKFEEAIKADPQSDGAWQGLGWAQLNQGKKQNAETSFKKCVKLNPQNAAALNGLGWIEHGKGDFDMAIKWWEKAVQAQPGATAAISGLTQVYMEKQDYGKAVHYYEIWLKAEPNSQEAKDGLEKAKQAIK